MCFCGELGPECEECPLCVAWWINKGEEERIERRKKIVYCIVAASTDRSSGLEIQEFSLFSFFLLLSTENRAFKSSCLLAAAQDDFWGAYNLPKRSFGLAENGAGAECSAVVI